jgi:Ca2+-binding RTX toxin-like protein
VPRHPFPLPIEPLESRRLFSITLHPDGLLELIGTPGSDLITVIQDPYDARLLDAIVNHTFLSFDARQLKKISVDAGDGNDLIILSRAIPHSVSSTILGGDGDDTIFSSDGNDFINAGAGDDSVWAGDGNNTVFGGDGNDFLATGNGNDKLYGGDGNDSIMGGDGNDLLVGGAGDDYLDGQSGRDTVSGGGGNDHLSGGLGTDVIIGGAGDNQYYPFDAPSEILGATASAAKPASHVVKKTPVHTVRAALPDR